MAAVTSEGVSTGVRVLIAEDERVLADTLAEGLRELSMAVDVCYNGLDAIERMSVNSYEVAIVDRDMPGRRGEDVCRWMRAQHIGTRVLMLTAAGSIRDRVDGLGLGADDYVAKPFAFAEVAARVQALARRPDESHPPVFESAGIVLDVPRHQVFRDGQLLGLSPKEFAVLRVLMQFAGIVVSAETLLERAWDEHIDPFTNVVRVTMMTLRRKLGEPPVIHTVPRVGYRFGEPS